MMEKALKNLGYGDTKDLFEKLCDFAMDGSEAVEKFKAMSKTKQRYTHIITDYSMPVMDGFEAAVKIRKFCDESQVAQPYIVAVTGHTESSYIKKAQECQVDDIMSKPVNLSIIENILKDFLGQEI